MIFTLKVDNRVYRCDVDIIVALVYVVVCMYPHAHS